jgi:hypothetical protein
MLVDDGRITWLNMLMGNQSLLPGWIGLYQNTVSWSRNTKITDIVDTFPPNLSLKPLTIMQPVSLLANGYAYAYANISNLSSPIAATMLVNGWYWTDFSKGILMGGDAFPFPYLANPFSFEVDMQFGYICSTVLGPGP